MSKLIPLLLSLLGSLIGLPEENRDIALWGASATGLGVVVWYVVEYVRKHVWQDLDGIAVVLVAIASGVILALGLGAGGVIEGSVVEWASFGFAAAVASGVVNLALKSGGAGKSLPPAE